jgi:hypothetical protein
VTKILLIKSAIFTKRSPEESEFYIYAAFTLLGLVVGHIFVGCRYKIKHSLKSDKQRTEANLGWQTWCQSCRTNSRGLSFEWLRKHH